MACNALLFDGCLDSFAMAQRFFCSTVQCSTIGGLETCCLTPTLLRRLEGSITLSACVFYCVEIHATAAIIGFVLSVIATQLPACCLLHDLNSYALSCVCKETFAALAARYPHCFLAQVVCLDPISCPSLEPLFLIAILGLLCLQLMLGHYHQCRST